jgi:hypothetical protein
MDRVLDFYGTHFHIVFSLAYTEKHTRTEIEMEKVLDSNFLILQAFFSLSECVVIFGGWNVRVRKFANNCLKHKYFFNKMLITYLCMIFSLLLSLGIKFVG